MDDDNASTSGAIQVDAENTTSRGMSRPISKKPCRFFNNNDCFRGDSCHMLHAAKHELPPCRVHLLWLDDPWTRPRCQWGERCACPHPAATGPSEAGLKRVNLALQTENSQITRVRAYAAGVLGAGGDATDVGVARSGTNRYNQRLALLQARDPEEFSRRCIADQSLCRSVLRVYILGHGVCSSLEEVGQKVSQQVASGRCSGAGTLPTSPATPLAVRVQALPKVMERHLIDEDGGFWEANFPNMVRERQIGVFSHVLSVVFVRGAFLYGLAEASTHGRSIIDNNTEDSPVCRAFYKIKEVTSRTSIAYDTTWTAIDIGAAPGGWTFFLASRCRHVLAVDPAELDPAVLRLSNVTHVRQMVQSAFGSLREQLLTLSGATHVPLSSIGDEDGGNGPDTEVVLSPSPADEGARSIGADVMVSDMNAEPCVVAEIILSALGAGLVRRGATVIVTFKDFCGRRKRMRDEVPLALSRLQQGIADRGAPVASERLDAAVASGLEVPARPRRWKVDKVETLNLLSGGRTEVTLVGKATVALH